MSQHIFETAIGADTVTAVIGWDRQAKKPFAFVEKDGREKLLYDSDLDLKSKGAKLEYFPAVLATMGIVVPSTLLEQVQCDIDRNAGNRICKYELAGSFCEVAAG